MLKMKEPINAITHLIGAVLSVVGLIWMILQAVWKSNGYYLAGAIVFGCSLILLYSASATYHWVRAKDNVVRVLRKVDHSMITVLIAGTYTPVCLTVLKGWMGWTLLGVIWSLAVAGSLMRILWMEAPRWLYTSVYLGMGWVAVFFLIPLYKLMSPGAFALMVAGGVLYSVGAVIYALKPSFLQWKRIGFHEIFHLFILGGSASHFAMVSGFLLQ